MEEEKPLIDFGDWGAERKSVGTERTLGDVYAELGVAQRLAMMSYIGDYREREDIARLKGIVDVLGEDATVESARAYLDGEYATAERDLHSGLAGWKMKDIREKRDVLDRAERGPGYLGSLIIDDGSVRF
jgi:hypothetical protein